MPASGWEMNVEAAVPRVRGHLRQLLELGRIRAGGGCDIYLACSGTPRLRLSGFLVTRKRDPNTLVAFCPLAPDATRSPGALALELGRQLRIAGRISEHPHDADDAVDAIGLTSIGSEDRPVPYWIYGLSCVPLTRDWDGNFVHPRPFCATLFTGLASQPSAVDWLRRRQSASPASSAHALQGSG
jgi:hypothetical protein